MTVSIIAGIVIALAVTTLGFRVVVLRRVTTSVTVLVGALMAALLLRIPTLGDGILDDAFGRWWGVHNLPDLMGHGLTFVAMGAAITYVSHVSSRVRLPVVYVSLAVLWAASVIVFIRSEVWEQSTENIVQAPGMGWYSAIFSVALLVTHSIVLRMVAPSVSNVSGTDLWQRFLLLGAGSGAIMAAHRLLVLLVPCVSEIAYQPITWVLSLTCIGGYIIACFLIGQVLRHQQADPATV